MGCVEPSIDCPFTRVKPAESDVDFRTSAFQFFDLSIFSFSVFLMFPSVWSFPTGVVFLFVTFWHCAKK